MRSRLVRAAQSVASVVMFGLCLVLIPTGTEAAKNTTGQAHDHSTMVGPHGGQVAKIGPFDAEIVMKGGILRVYLHDHLGEDHTAKAAGGDAILLVGGGNKRVPLAVGEQGLSGRYSFPVSSAMKGVIRVKMLDGKTHTGKAVIDEQ